jgi:Arc/MetJ-type ribon-helix-helix transcriptional regulator
MPVVSTDISNQMNEDLKLLIAAGLYKSKSEALRDAIRSLSHKYKDRIKDVKEMRARMGERKGKESLSGVLEDIRNEEMS